MKDLAQLPQNQLRKVFTLTECILRLEELQRRYKPIFDEDTVINNVLKEMKEEKEILMAGLREREDALELLEALDDKPQLTSEEKAPPHLNGME